MAIKYRPILFNGEMVRALLSGHKTVTRRAIKVQPFGTPKWNSGYLTGVGERDYVTSWLDEAGRFLECPHGNRGDRLWVRETWYCDHHELMSGPYLQPSDMNDLDRSREEGELVYAADDLTPYETDQPIWKPSIHMPRWVCRIELEITDVRVERLQDITEEQARAEGITDGGCCSCGNSEPCGCDSPAPSAIDSFYHLWKSTGGDWDANPWVWVIEFKRVMP